MLLFFIYVPKITKKIKVDSIVKIISGKNKGMTVKIKQINCRSSQVFLENVSYKTDIVTDSNGIKSFQTGKMIPVDISNIQLV